MKKVVELKRRDLN